MKDIQIIENSPNLPQRAPSGVITRNDNGVSKPVVSNGTKIVDALTAGFPKILDIVSDIVSIRKIEKETEAYVQKVDAKIKLLETETKAYIQQIREQSDKEIKAIDALTAFTTSFLQNNNGQIKSEDFQKIMSDVINKVIKDYE